jgi:phosphate:Na+ symporter
MLILKFLIIIAGATMQLLLDVRLVRTCIERSFGASFRRIMTVQQSLVQPAAWA